MTIKQPRKNRQNGNSRRNAKPANPVIKPEDAERLLPDLQPQNDQRAADQGGASNPSDSTGKNEGRRDQNKNKEAGKRQPRQPGQTASGRIIDIGQTNIAIVDPNEDWEATYRSIYGPMLRGEAITRAVTEVAGIQLDTKYQLMTGLYLVWGSKGTGKSTRFSVGIPNKDLMPLRLKLANLEGVKVAWAKTGEPDYATNLLFPAEFQQIIQVLSSPYDAQNEVWNLVIGPLHSPKTVTFAGKNEAKVLIIDSLSALLNYQTKHAAEEGERDSGVCLKLDDRYMKEEIRMSPSGAATSGGVPGSIIHELRLLQNLARTNGWLVLGLINPLQLDQDISASKLISQINSATNGTLPLDMKVSSRDNRFYSEEFEGPDRVDLVAEGDPEELSVSSTIFDALHRDDNIKL